MIEVPIGGEPIKYEMDKESGALQVDRFLYTSMRYPGNYGFIPHTLSDDGDPCDVIVANTRAIVPGAVMSCRVVGVLVMEDEAGGDEKLLAVPSAKLTQRYAHIHNYADLPSITLQQIEHFFAHYKDLEPNKWVKVVRWGDARRSARAPGRGHRAGQEGQDNRESEELRGCEWPNCTLPVAASNLDGGAPARERLHFGEKDHALGDELRPEPGRRSMSERKIAVTPSAYSYPLLIKQLLHAPLAQTPRQEIVYRDVRRLTYLKLRDRIGRLASVLEKIGVRPAIRSGFSTGTATDFSRPFSPSR